MLTKIITMEEAFIGTLFLSFIGLIISLLFLRMAMEVSSFVKYQKSKLFLQILQMQKQGIPNGDIKMILLSIWGKIPKEMIKRLE